MQFAPTPIRGRLVNTPEEVIRDYTPRGIPEQTWKKQQPIVQNAARHYYSPGPRGAKSAMYICSRYIHWADKTGVPLEDPEKLFHPSLVTRFCSTQLNKYVPNTRATYRAVLICIGRNITRKAPWPDFPEIVPDRKHRTDPYTSEEIEGYIRATRIQSTPKRTRVLTAIIALGHGAGVTPQELLKVTAHHLHENNNHIFLTVPDSARVVPVLPRYNPWLKTLIEIAGDEPLIGITKAAHDPLSHLRRGIIFPSYLPPLKLTQLRSTWMLHHLNTAVPLNVLVTWAGLKHTEAFRELLPFMDTREQDIVLHGEPPIGTPPLT